MRESDLQVTHARAFVNGIQMHYVTRGKGPLVVLLHGFPEMWWTWRYQIEPLVEAGFRVVVPDMRGYNETECRGPYDLDTLATDIRTLIDVLGESKAHIVGHDWGGGVAWHFAAHHPTIIDKLVVLNCPHPSMMQKALLRSFQQMKKSWYMFFFQLPWLPEKLLMRGEGEALRNVLREQAVDPSHCSDEELAPFVANILKPGVATAMLNYYRTAVPQGLFRGKMITPIIRCDTLLLWGMGDKALGFQDLVPGTEKLVDRLRVHTIDRCGHFVQSERPDVVNPQLVSFLRGY